jgi:fructose-1-phosphate kinase PfkB-like protein
MFLGGRVGAQCHDLLINDDHLDPLVVTTASPTRVILTVRTEDSPDQTAFFDPDPEITRSEAAALSQEIETALAAPGIEALTLSGSSPSLATHGLFRDLIRLARQRLVPVLLDTYGPALDALCDEWPDAIQLNRREAAMHLRTTTDNLTDAHVFALLDDWSSRGVSCGIVTNGPGPALARIHGVHYRAHPPALAALNPIGSGDCLLAGVTQATISRLDADAMLRHGVACAAANILVWDAGAIDPKTVRHLEAAVVIEAGSGCSRPAPVRTGRGCDIRAVSRRSGSP